jgi:hypothetical protein
MQSSYTAGTSVPVTVSIKSIGANTLTSAKINWSVNGVLQPQYTWTGNLAHGVESSPIVLDSVIISGPFDLVVYTTLPNGVIDMNTRKDTITFSAAGCDTLLSGSYTVGLGGDFTSFNTAWAMIEYCGIKDNVTLNVFPGTYTFEKTIKKMTGGSKNIGLTIASSTNNANDVVFTGRFVFDNAENITLKNITVNNTTASTSVIEFIGLCSNIEINGCNILANPTGTTATVSGFYYNNTSASGKRLDNIRILNNNIDGGYANIYLYYRE